MLPAVDRMIELAKAEACFELIPASVVTAAIREVIDADRRRIRAGDPAPDAAELADAAVLQRVKSAVAAAMRPKLRPVVNATGVVLHTNLGRALLARRGAGRPRRRRQRLLQPGVRPGPTGRARFALHAVEALLCELTGAEAALVVNNNAAAVAAGAEHARRGPGGDRLARRAGGDRRLVPRSRT